jgi:hypothetical protein
MLLAAPTPPVFTQAQCPHRDPDFVRDICGQAPFNVPTVVEVCTSGVVETVFLDKVIGVMFTIEIESSSPSDPMSRAEIRETQRETYHLKGISVSVKLW